MAKIKRQIPPVIPARLTLLALNVLGRLLAASARARPARAGGGRRRADPLAGAEEAPGPALEPAPCLSRQPAGLAPRGRPGKLPPAGGDGDALPGGPLPLRAADPRDRAVSGPRWRPWPGTSRRVPSPVVLATLHLALWESQTWLKMLSPDPASGIRHHLPAPRQPLARRLREEDTRSGTGCGSCRRREGFAEALGILRAKGCVGVLFDQNAGDQGPSPSSSGACARRPSCPASSPTKFGAELRTFYPRRAAFWRVTFESDPVPFDGTAAGATLALNRWFEGAMRRRGPLRLVALGPRPLAQPGRARAAGCASRRSATCSPEDLRARGLAGPPAEHPGLDPPAELAGRRRDGRAAPSRAARLAPRRGDHAPCEAGLRPPPRVLGPRRPGPRPAPSGAGLSRALRRRCAPQYPDVWILLTNSAARGPRGRGSRAAPSASAILRPGSVRPLLSHAYRLPAGFDEARHHQLELWEDFLRHFGLRGTLDRSPFPALAARAGAGGPIGLIAGSENDPVQALARRPLARARSRPCPASGSSSSARAADAAITAEICARPRPGPRAEPGGKDEPRRIRGRARGVPAPRVERHGRHAPGERPRRAAGRPLRPDEPRPHGARLRRRRTGSCSRPGCPPTGGGPLADLRPAPSSRPCGDLP